MNWFKNVMIYRLTSELKFDEQAWAEKLAGECFHPCHSGEKSRFGWQKPLSGSDLYYFRQGEQLLLVSHKEEKNLPANVIKSELESRVAEMEEKESRKLKKTEKEAIKDNVIAALLPRAFSKHQFTSLWIDFQAQLIYVDAASAKRAEDSLALLRKTLGSLPVVPLSFVVPPSEKMTHWLAQSDFPAWLTPLEEAELKSFETDSLIRCKRQVLESEEIAYHLNAGKQVTKLAFEWENHFSAVLNEDATLSRVKFADEIREKNDDILKEDKAQRFDADFLLMTAELQAFTEKLREAFGEIKGVN